MNPMQKMVDALAGRQRTAGADQDDARRELEACGAQLAAAQHQIADQGQEIALLRADLTAAVKAAERFRSEGASLLAANRVLMRIADGRDTGGQAIDGQAPAATPAELLRRQADQDRRNVAALADRIDDLIRENEQLIKALAG